MINAWFQLFSVLIKFFPEKVPFWRISTHKLPFLEFIHVISVFQHAATARLDFSLWLVFNNFEGGLYAQNGFHDHVLFFFQFHRLVFVFDYKKSEKWKN